MEVFTAASSERLADEKYSDFTILYSGKERKVHRLIITAHSEWFEKCCAGEFSESKSRQVELKEDHPAAVTKMYIEFFYSFDYDCSAISTTTEETTEIDDQMQLNARVYAVAEKYEVPGLKALALQKFRAAVTECVKDTKALLQAVETVYNEVELPGSDRELHQTISSAWVFCVGRVEDLKDPKSKLRELCKSNAYFMFDVHMTFLDGFMEVNDQPLGLEGAEYLRCADCKQYGQVPSSLSLGDCPDKDYCNVCREETEVEASMIAVNFQDLRFW